MFNPIISNFLSKASHYRQIPPLIKDSSCDHNAKICKKYGYVKLVKSTKTGNIYQITPKGWNYIKTHKQTPGIFNLINI